ncbi:MAG: FG-GAP-like repeat-containing protein [Pseudomonadota bacterium]
MTHPFSFSWIRCPLAILALSSFNFIAPVQAQMVIPGNFNVSPVGAATYTIPIQTPPGIANIEPKLALSYNSRSGNGLLGVGWSLSGLSAITRCPQTQFQDASRTGINYTSSDRFCLDGKRLMVVSGAYGAASSEYRTEIDDLSRIIAYGAAPGGGPNYFIVKNKYGQTFEYGNTTDSKINVTGLSPQVVRTWALNKINDSKGNTLTVSYTQDTTNSVFNGGYYPTSILYTSNSATGLTATNNIMFSYDLTRADQISGYLGGYAYLNRARLTAITTQTNSTNVLTYSLSYEPGSSTGRSRLKSIGVCSASGNCLPSTTLSYPTDLTALPSVQTHTMTGDTALLTDKVWVALDVNGDGWSDLIHFHHNGNYTRLINNSNGTYSATNFSQTIDPVDPYTDSSVQWLTLDVNGDGLMDMVHVTSSQQLYVWKSTGTGGFTISSFYSPVGGGWLLADINGDGLLDLVHTEPLQPTLYMHISNGDGTFTYQQNGVAGAPIDAAVKVMDANGDGRADLIYLSYNNNLGQGGIHSLLSKGDGTFTVKAQNIVPESLKSSAYIQSDVNGDGLVDLIMIHPELYSQPQPSVYISKGDGTFDRRVLSSGVDPTTTMTGGAWFISGEYHGNNLLDFVHQYTSTYNNSYLWSARGDGTFNITAFANGSLGESIGIEGISILGDFSATGSLDTIKIINNTTYETWSATDQSKDIPSSIIDGLSKSIQWTGNTLAHLPYNSYSKSLTSTPTVLTVSPAIPVVTSVKITEPKGVQRETRYAYDSARFEPKGRGFLGFNWIQSQNVDTGIYRRSVYNLNFPFLGMISMDGIGINGGTGWSYFNLTTNTWSCINPATGTACTVNAGNRYFIYPSQIDTVPNDFNWPLPRTRVQNQNVDNYGNIGTIITSTLNSDGSNTGYSKTTTNTYYNDTTNWYIGRLLKSTTTSTSPITLPTPVIPGSGGLAPAPAPTAPNTLPPGWSQMPIGTLVTIINYLLF